MKRSRFSEEQTIGLEGDVAGILAVATRNDKAVLSGINPDECEALVAGVGFEPTTFRL